jgi:hypothetical protein
LTLPLTAGQPVGGIVGRNIPKEMPVMADEEIQTFTIPVILKTRRNLENGSAVQDLCAGIEEALAGHFEDADYEFVALSPSPGGILNLRTDKGSFQR